MCPLADSYPAAGYGVPDPSAADGYTAADRDADHPANGADHPADGSAIAERHADANPRSSNCHSLSHRDADP